MEAADYRMHAVLAAACLGFAVVQIDVSVVNIGLPQIGGAFSAGLGGLQWVINSYSLTFSAVLLLGGSWADRIGAKKVFLAGFVIFSLSSIGCGIATGLPMLISMRLLQGFGVALILPCALSLIRTGYDNPEARRSAIAVFGAFGGIGMAAGPLVGNAGAGGASS
ncbi:MFS transporter [Roseomonas gilardii]|uniref:MFS transporter n=1 Tax=Roseomonas gilardii TaxID=257708 RepID=A0ABU3MK91_9PROT|nr:MFS transporter [Roseomonas gilardii]MDT8332876.1 MFS transporter [Roseomonas gilardii]